MRISIILHIFNNWKIMQKFNRVQWGRISKSILISFIKSAMKVQMVSLMKDSILKFLMMCLNNEPPRRLCCSNHIIVNFAEIAI